MSALEVGFLLRGHLYGNNSIVNVTDIGEGSQSLFCVTNNEKCCRKIDNEIKAQGNWYFPNNGSPVDVRINNENGFYKNRGPGVVRLHRTNDTSSPTGLFNCTLPDEDDKNQIIYIGIYSLENGKQSTFMDFDALL